MRLDRVIAVRNDKTIFRDGDQCVKVFSHRYSKADVLNEALNLARMEECGIHVPQIISVNKIEGKWAYVSEYIKGKTLEQLMMEHPERKEEYMNVLVELQVDIHGKTCTALSEQKDVLNYKISTAQLDATTRYAMHFHLSNMAPQKNICHGDFNPSNIIITEDGIPYVIDWSKSVKGDVTADAAATYLYFCCKEDTEAAQKYLDLISEKGGLDKEKILKWVPIVAASEFMERNEIEKKIMIALIKK